jgi:hypothetical protein
MALFSDLYRAFYDRNIIEIEIYSLVYEVTGKFSLVINNVRVDEQKTLYGQFVLRGRLTDRWSRILNVTVDGYFGVLRTKLALRVGGTIVPLKKIY